MDLRPVAVLVARASACPHPRAVGILGLVLATTEHPPTVHVAVPVDEYLVDVTVRHAGRRLALLVRNGPNRTDADLAVSTALSRAGWGVLWVLADRCLTRPQLVVRDILAAVETVGVSEPFRPAERPARRAPPSREELRQGAQALRAGLGLRPLAWHTGIARVRANSGDARDVRDGRKP